MARIKVKNQIQIERNVIENFLISVKDFLKERRTAVLILLAVVAVVLIAFVITTVALESIKKNEMAQYEEFLSKYKSRVEAGDREKIIAVIGDFAKFVQSAHTDFIEETGRYAVGNMFFSQKMYKESRDHLLKYAEESPESEFTPLAILKSAVASEELNDMDGAYNLLRRLESEYRDSIVADQIYYNIARYYLKKNDAANAKKYLEREISSHPESPYALLAKKRLLLLHDAR